MCYLLSGPLNLAFSRGNKSQKSDAGIVQKLETKLGVTKLLFEFGNVRAKDRDGRIDRRTSS
jgi:hypothetical protein